MGAPFPKTAPSYVGSRPHLYMIPWARLSSQPKRHHHRFSRFRTDDRSVSLGPTLQWAVPSSLKITPSYGPWGDLDPPSNTWFPGPTRVLNPNSILIGSAALAGLTNVTDRPTDHATWSLTIDRRSTYVVLRCGLIIMITSGQSNLT